MMKKILFRLDCSQVVGQGHFSRCLSLAESLANYECFFVIRGEIPPGFQNKLERMEIKSLVIDEEVKLDQEIIKIDTFLKDNVFSCVIFDFTSPYTFEEIDLIQEYFHVLKNKMNCQFVLIDGMNSDSLACSTGNLNVDFVITPYPGARKIVGMQYEHLVGIEYFVFNSVFNKIKGNPEGRKKDYDLLITMGGADPSGITKKCIKAFENEPFINNKRIKIIIGPLFSDELEGFVINKAKSLGWDFDKAPHNLLDEFLNTKAALTTTGLTKYELAKVGVPSILIAHVKEAEALNLPFEVLNTSKCIGYIGELSLKEISEKVLAITKNVHELKEMEKNGLAIFGKAGRSKTTKLIVEIVSSF